MLRRILRVVLLLLVVATAAYFITSLGLTNNTLTEKLSDYGNELSTLHEHLEEAKSSVIEKANSIARLQTELASVTEELAEANLIIEALAGDAYKLEFSVSEKELDMIAKTVWGEARGCDKLQQSAVVWCILNRVDAGHGTIAKVITAKDQFHGYSRSNPVTNDIKLLVKDVVTRWMIEKLTCGDVGRTLPSNYLYFSSSKTGNGNVFRTEYKGNYEVWDWSYWNPYA